MNQKVHHAEGDEGVVEQQHKDISIGVTKLKQGDAGDGAPS